MTVRKTLTKSVEKRITEDWQREIPSLGVYRPRHLLRRAGPLLVGICLDRDSSGEIYKPIFHVHCLCKDFPCVSLTLGTQLRSEHSGGPDFVQVRWHEEKYKGAAARMVPQSLLPLEGDLSLEQVVGAYRSYMATPLGNRQAALLYRDIIILAAWAGDQAGAVSMLDGSLREMSGEADFRHVGGRGAFEADCRRLIENPELIHHTVDSQIEALGVGTLPVSNMLR